MDNTRLTKEGLWRAVLGDATGAPAKPAAAAAAAAATKGKGKEKETEKPVKEAESCFLFKRKFLKYVVLASATPSPDAALDTKHTIQTTASWTSERAESWPCCPRPCCSFTTPGSWPR